MFFFDLSDSPLKKRVTLKVPPQAPETGWRAPTDFPNLSAATVIGFDVETKEMDWDHGPGWSRGKSHIVGFSLAARDNLGNAGNWYFPIRHAVDVRDNLDSTRCLSYLRSVLHTPKIPKVGANLIFDIGTLTDENIFVQGELHDVQFAEALLKSDGEVNLDWLGLKYLGEGKKTNLLYEWCAQAYGGKPNHFQRDNIWRAPPKLVGPYGERDASSPIEIIEKQIPLLWSEGLYNLYRMECGLIPLLVKMRIAGISVDIPAAHQLYDELEIDIKRLYNQLAFSWGKVESVNSADQIAKLFDDNGIKYPKTEHGNPSFRKDFLKNLEHPLATLINEIREHEKIRGTFVRNYILEGHINGKIHCQFNPLRGDDTGAVTGRFSSSDPNLQNIPIRSQLGKRVRAIFVKDIGHFCYEKNDFSQMEYRDLAHYAVDKGDGSAQRLRDEYIKNPNTDYHIRTQSETKRLTGIEIERRPIKNMNFGLIYGMSEDKLIRQNGFSPQQGKIVFKAYHEANPYVRPTMAAAATEMQLHGYITTILDRRTRFNLWEPMFRDYNSPKPNPLPFEQAIRFYGSALKRAGEHKAINYRLQGSNAEQIKKGMYDCYYSGVFDYTTVPRLQIHDELGHSVVDDTPATNEAFREMRHILETCIPHIRVPVRVDWKRGPNWGACE